jgi:DNA-binding transcriptional ArsR family regulator
MGDAALKAKLFEQLARVGKALGNGKRLELVDLLGQGPRSVAELAAAAGLGVTTTSQHAGKAPRFDTDWRSRTWQRSTSRCARLQRRISPT